MRIKTTTIAEWPKLAWVARTHDGSHEVEVLHGPMVEVADEWIVEAVWAGDFAAGDFDRTELVFGSGVRLRGDKAVFVSAGTVFDRLWHVQYNGVWFVSNTLPGLLAVADLQLRDDYTRYSLDIRTITRGLEDRVRSIPTSGPDVTSVYYHNIVFDGSQLREEPKPDTAPNFRDFQQYDSYLVETAEHLGANLSDDRRAHKIEPVSTISSGYDSCVAAVISRHAGCRKTVTIKDSSSLWRGSDSGAPVAKILGMECTEYPRTAKNYPLEEAIWAAEGRPGILNWTLFDYPEPLSLVFTGCHGEKLWERVDHDDPDPFVRRDPSSLGFCEFRLLKGAFQCPIPFWAVRHSQQIRAITATDEMRPWSMNKDYDKPIARRIVEEAGVPRREFGTSNKNTSLESAFWWPFSRSAKAEFTRHLCERSIPAPQNWLVWLLRNVAHIDSLIYKNTLKRLHMPKGHRPWQDVEARSHIFQWATSRLESFYRVGLDDQTARNESRESLKKSSIQT